VGLSGEVYDTPLHLQPVFEPWADGPLPGAEQLCASHVCLPISAVLTEEQARRLLESGADVMTQKDALRDVDSDLEAVGSS